MAKLHVALPRGARVPSDINGLEKGLGKSRCIQFQWVSGLPPKPSSNTGTAPTALTSPTARGRALDEDQRTPLSPSSADDIARENAEARMQAAARCCRNPLRIIAGDGEPYKAVRTINDHC